MMTGAAFLLLLLLCLVGSVTAFCFVVVAARSPVDKSRFAMEESLDLDSSITAVVAVAGSCVICTIM